MARSSAKGVSEDAGRSTFILFGAVLFVALFAIPVVNAVWSLNNLVYDHFLPSLWSQGLVVLSVLVIIAWTIFMLQYFAKAPAESQSDQSIILIVVTFLVLAGAIYLIIGDKLRYSATLAGDQVWNDCQTGPDSSALFHRYQELLAARMEPSCMAEVSIEDCSGVNVGGHRAKVLKAIETQFMCAGYCLEAFQATEAAKADAMTLLQTSIYTGTDTVSVDTVRLELHGPGGPSGPGGPPDPVKVGIARRIADDNSNAGGSPRRSELAGSEDALDVWYPPTLFSQANYEVSCDGLVARRLYDYAASPASFIVWEGISLIALSVFAAVASLPCKCGELLGQRQAR